MANYYKPILFRDTKTHERLGYCPMEVDYNGAVIQNACFNGKYRGLEIDPESLFPTPERAIEHYEEWADLNRPVKRLELYKENIFF